MFDVLVYLFENYRTPQLFPQTDALAKKLTTVGFDEDDVDRAIDWLLGLATATQNITLVNHAAQDSTRVYAREERQQLGDDAIGFLSYLDAAGELAGPHRELVIERALAVGESPLPLEQLRIITLMVLWSQEVDFGTLLLDELLAGEQDSRKAH
jgi:Smg protein